MKNFDSSTFYADSEQDSPRSTKKRQFPWGIPRLSGVSFGGSSASSFTPQTTDSGFDIMKKTSSMSALDLQQQQGKNDNDDDENEDPRNVYYVSPERMPFSEDISNDLDEPFFLGMRRESFGVGDHYRQTSLRFRTKRFRSRLELGMS